MDEMTGHLSFVDKLNNVIEFLNETTGQLNSLTDAVNYLQEQGLDSSIVDNLNTMINDGTLGNLINNTLLDTINTEVTEINSDVQKIKKPVIGLNECIITFTDDDGQIESLLKYKPVMDQYGIKANFAVNTSKVGTTGYMTWDNLKQMQSEGHEISSHGHTHISIATSTDTDANFTLSESKRLFDLNGINATTYIYAGSPSAPWSDTRQRDIVKKYFDCGVATQNNILNTTPLDTFCLTRYDLVSRDLPTLQGYVDTNISNKSWLIFMCHSWDTNFDPVKVGNLIQYIKSKNIKIVTLSQGLEMMGNVVEVGAPNLPDYYALSKNGKTKGFVSPSTFPISVDGTGATGDLQGNLDVPLTSYTANRVTFQKASSTALGTYPNGGGNGTISTYRFSEDRFGYQKFKYIANDTEFTRRWDSTNNVWLAWAQVGVSTSSSSITMKRETGNSGTLNLLATDFTPQCITYSELDTTSGASSPTATKGLLTTYRTEQSLTQFTYQEWRGYHLNSVYQRYWNSTVWGSWTKISVV